jgi:hypothetical protein
VPRAERQVTVDPAAAGLGILPDTNDPATEHGSTATLTRESIPQKVVLGAGPGEGIDSVHVCAYIQAFHQRLRGAKGEAGPGIMS